MNDIDLADRKARKWALACYTLAAALLLALIAGQSMGSDFVDGLWTGMAAVCALALMPWRRWLRPNTPLARMLDDDGVREHRRISCTAGFWAALAASLVLAPIAHEGMHLTGFDVARVVATAALCAAMTSFATLELRAARD